MTLGPLSQRFNPVREDCMAKYGVALVGTGFIGPVHVEALRRLGRPIVGVLGSTPERSRLMAERLAIPRAYDSYDELLADDAVGAIHITSPKRYHDGQFRRRLAADR